MSMHKRTFLLLTACLFAAGICFAKEGAPAASDQPTPTVAAAEKTKAEPAVTAVKKQKKARHHHAARNKKETPQPATK